METFLNYLFTLSIATGILFIAYKLIFSNAASLKLNRVILLTIVLYGFTGVIISSQLIKLFTFFDTHIASPVSTTTMFTIGLRELAVYSGPTIDPNHITGILLKLTLLIYLLGVTFMSVRFFISLFKIVKLYAVSEKVQNNHQIIVLLKDNIPAFSFFKILFINKKLFNREEAFQTVIQHEKIHGKQFHSVDVLFVELLKIFQWFNPFVYKLKNAIVENHEYLADRGTIDSMQNIHDYKVMILTHASSNQTYRFTNNFSFILIKKRIKMMEKNSSKTKSLLSLVAFVVIILSVSISCSDSKEKSKTEDLTPAVQKDQLQQKDELIKDHQVAENEDLQTVAKNDSIYTFIEQMPMFRGGKKALFDYLRKNLKYPEQAKKRGIQGRVFVNFIVETDGSITNAKVLKGIGYGCDKEALRVVNAMPKWIPGKHQGKYVRFSFNIPIKFVATN